MQASHDLREILVNRFHYRVIAMVGAPSNSINHLNIATIANVGIQSDEEFGIVGNAGSGKGGLRYKRPRASENKEDRRQHGGEFDWGIRHGKFAESQELDA